jgi:hypothetical protein
MKNSNDTVGNRTRDLLACSAVPQPTAPPRPPQLTNIFTNIGDLKAVKKKLLIQLTDCVHLQPNLPCSSSVLTLKFQLHAVTHRKIIDARW